VLALVISRLNYCNSVLAALPQRKNQSPISAEFSQEIEDCTVSEIVYDQQVSMTQFFVTWLWSFFTYRTWRTSFIN